MPVVHKPSPEWASHIPVLLKVLELTDGPVLELGMGYMSTPLLHMICLSQNRFLMSAESDSYYTELFKRFQTEEGSKHRFGTDYLGPVWSVVLVDQKPAAARKESIKQLTDAEYLIVHDSNATDDYYGYEEIYPLFKYRYDYTKFANHTMVLSNKHDVQDKLHNTLDK